MTDYRNKRIVVVGAGRSGTGLARYFQQHGAKVTLSDRRSLEQLPAVDQLALEGIGLDLGGHSEALFTGADLIALSPGVPLEIPAIARASAAGKKEPCRAVHWASSSAQKSQRPAAARRRS